MKEIRSRKRSRGILIIEPWMLLDGSLKIKFPPGTVVIVPDSEYGNTKFFQDTTVTVKKIQIPQRLIRGN